MQLFIPTLGEFSHTAGRFSGKSASDFVSMFRWNISNSLPWILPHSAIEIGMIRRNFVGMHFDFALKPEDFQIKANMRAFPEMKCTCDPKRNWESAKNWKWKFTSRRKCKFTPPRRKSLKMEHLRARRFRFTHFLNVDIISEFAAFAPKRKRRLAMNWKCKFTHTKPLKVAKRRELRARWFRRNHIVNIDLISEFVF